MPFQRSFRTIGIALCLWAIPAFAQLETRSSVRVDSSPYSIAIGDFNHDGVNDLAVVAFLTSYVAVLIGNRDGTFQKATYYDAVASSVAVGDFRNNGILDLALADNLNNQMQILLGNGDGTFGPSSFYSTPDFPNVIALGDFNGDHKLDVVTVDESGYCPCISVLLGNGDGSFQEPPITTMPPVAAVAIGLGDFNHDGILDIVSVGESRSGNQAEILLGNGDGTFTFGATYTIGSGPQSVAVGDFNRDGNLDIAIADPFAGSVDILLGNGDGTFRQGTPVPGDAPAEVRVADMNGDGKLDLVFQTGVSTNGLAIAYGNGNGTFQPAINFPIPGEPVSPAIADFNGDHRSDVALADYSGNSVMILLNTGVVRFSPISPLNFKKQAAGSTSAPQSVTLTNTGKTALNISSMKVAGQFAMTSTCRKSVAAGANCKISVAFSPKTQGPKSGTVSIVDSASSKPQVIELSGIGD